MSLRPDWSGLPAAIRAGADWMAVEQPPDAVIDQFGPGEWVADYLYLSFAPHGSWGRKTKAEGTVATVIVQQSRGRGNYGYENHPELPPFTEDEIDSIAALFVDAGLEILDRWNGAGLDSGSFEVRLPGVDNPSLSASYDHYHDGCPEHHTVFCGYGEGWPGNENCSWLHDGHAAAIPPGWVAVAMPAGEGDGDRPPADDDSNLEAIRVALERLAPLLAELGHHPTVFAAGRRGRIEGEPGDLSFQEEHGHGILMPAETAEALVALALVGWEVQGS